MALTPGNAALKFQAAFAKLCVNTGALRAR